MSADNIDIGPTQLIYPTVTGNYLQYNATGATGSGISGRLQLTQTTTGGPNGPALKIINSDPGPTGPAIVQYHNTISPTGSDVASSYVTNANVIVNPGGILAERMYSNIKTVLTNGSTGPTGPSASIAFDLANGSATGVTGGMATIMTISGRDPTPYPTFLTSALSEPQGVQITTTDNTGSTNRRDIAGLRVQNISNNANGAVIQTVKLRQPIGTISSAANRDIIGAWSAWGTSSAGFYREYSRIRTQISNSVAGGSIGPDGAVVIAVAENDNTGITPLKDMFRCDGGYALTLPAGPTGPYNLSYATMVFNPTGASGPQDITGIKAIGNDAFNYGVTGQCLISNGPNSSFTWGTQVEYFTFLTPTPIGVYISTANAGIVIGQKTFTVPLGQTWSALNVNVSFSRTCTGTTTVGTSSPLIFSCRIEATRTTPPITVQGIVFANYTTLPIVLRGYNTAPINLVSSTLTTPYINGSFMDVLYRQFSSNEEWTLQLICSANILPQDTNGWLLDTTTRNEVTFTFAPSIPSSP
jgi:hypothetical protein